MEATYCCKVPHQGIWHLEKEGIEARIVKAFSDEATVASRTRGVDTTFRYDGDVNRVSENVSSGPLPPAQQR